MIGLLVVATALRVSGLGAGLPYSSYIDEGHYLHPTAHMIAEDTYHGGDYQNPYEHPSLPYDAIALSAELYRLTGDTGIKEGAIATDQTPYYDLMQPSELILIGRLVILAFSVGTVLLTVLLGTRLIGRRAGLIAGTLVAFLPVLVAKSTVVTADAVVTFFTAAAVLAACALATVPTFVPADAACGPRWRAPCPAWPSRRSTRPARSSWSRSRSSRCAGS